MCDSIIRAMQSDSELRQHYNVIVQDIDTCLTVEKLCHKASTISDRQVVTDVTSEPQTYVSHQHVKEPDAIEKRFEQMEKKFTLMAKQFEPKAKSDNRAEPKPKGNKDKKNRKWGNRWNDPEWRKSKANEECNNMKNYRQCVRENCPYAPCNKKAPGQSLYTNFSGFP